ncbi:hypothetical protein [Clostridium sp. HBUAS56010]|uniref:hypothetical protein n=1 Tax=Clostridium sp. HBUAS56010 TaxID=2571127 RepID=UPI001178B1C3|nr:hypothetical protein [Clostridium sp. HBUAS56010]
MDSRKILEEFAAIDGHHNTMTKAIVGTHILDCEEEYGTDLVHFTDEMLFDFFLIKKKYYRLFHISLLVSQFSQFYNYCVIKGYIKYDPLQQSLLFSKDYLIDKIATLGNVKLYSREYVKRKCEEIGINVPYYLSIVLLLYDGVQSQKELASLKYEDVDFAKKQIFSGGCNLPLCADTIKAIKNMYELENFVVLSKTGKPLARDFYDDNNFLIRQIVSTRNTVPTDNIEQNKKVLSRKFKVIDLDPGFLSDSSILFRLADRIGKDVLINIFNSEQNGERQRDIELLKNALEEFGIGTSAKNFLFNYRVYSPLLEENVIL